MSPPRLDWTDELERWLEPFMDALGHSTRRRMCPIYVAGLIGPGDRKSVQPMAARDKAVNYDQLHHFIGSSVWDAAPLEAALLVEADELVGGEDAWTDPDEVRRYVRENAARLSGLSRREALKNIADPKAGATR